MPEATLDMLAPVRTRARVDRLSVFARTDRGRVRERNQDGFLVASLAAGTTGLGPETRSHRVGERGSLLAVSDGTGAGEGGELASAMVLETLHRVFNFLPASIPPAEQLRRATRFTGLYVWDCIHRAKSLRGIGATLTAVLVRDGAAHVAQVGDSRAYLIRGETIRQLTTDQTLAQALVDSGAIRPGETKARPPDMLVQTFGAEQVIEAALTSVELLPNDILLLCSDGLSNALTPADLALGAREAPGLEEACRRLVELADERGGRDNATVVLARAS